MENEGDKQTTEAASRRPDGQLAGDLPFDAEKYKCFVEDTDLTEEQQVEFLQTLFSIMKAFVDLGFGVNSIQSFIPELAANSSDSQSDPVESRNCNTSGEFEKAATDAMAEGGKS